MRQRAILSLLFALSSIMAYAQIQKIQGRVIHEGEPLAKANVVELDANHRVINQTQTDVAGFFSMIVSGGKTSVRVTYDGMRRFTRKIGTQTTWEIELEKDNETDGKRVKSRYETNKLLVGHVQGRAVPQLTWLEHLTDTTFCLVVPVRVFKGVEDYPSGRKITVQDYNSRIVATGECIETATAEEGAPESWDPFVRTSTNNSADNNSQFTTDDRDYFCYPRFVFSKTELEYLIDHSTEIACFAVDTSRGDNYWLYYTSKNFGKELQKLLNRMLK